MWRLRVVVGCGLLTAGAAAWLEHQFLFILIIIIVEVGDEIDPIIHDEKAAEGL